jgi:hypothetical protein
MGSHEISRRIKGVREPMCLMCQAGVQSNGAGCHNRLIQAGLGFPDDERAMTTSRMFDSYCADLDVLLREGQLRMAVRAAVALPDICAALEDPRMLSSAERYAEWCATWLQCSALERGKPNAALRLHRLYHRLYLHPKRPQRGTSPKPGVTTNALSRFRMRRRARPERALSRLRVWQPTNRLETFEVELVESLVSGARRWYRETAADNPRVQQNLGRLAISG